MLAVVAAVAWFRAWSHRRIERTHASSDEIAVTSFRATYLILAGLSASGFARGVVGASSSETRLPCLLGAIVAYGCFALIAPGRRNVEEFASRLRVSGYSGDLLTALMTTP